LASVKLRSVEIADLLGRLADKSLALYDPASERYRFLGTVEEFAFEHLRPLERKLVLPRFMTHLLNVTSDPVNKVRGRDQLLWVGIFDREMDNFRAAFNEGISTPEMWAAAAELAYRLIHYWHVRSLQLEGIDWLEGLLAKAPAEAVEARSLILGALGTCYRDRGNPRHIEVLREALHLGQKANSARAVCFATLWLGFSLMFDGQLEEAYATISEALPLLRKENEGHDEAFAYYTLGMIEVVRGQYAEAESSYAECARLREANGDMRGVGSIMGAMSQLAEVRGDFASAARFSRQAMLAAPELGTSRKFAHLLSGECNALWLAGRHTDAARVLGFSDVWLERLGEVREHGDQAACDRWADRLSHSLGEREHAASYQNGRESSPDDIAAMLDLPAPIA